MTTVVFTEALGADPALPLVYSDDANPTTGMKGDGYLVLFFPMITQAVNTAQRVKEFAELAEAFAASALGAATANATSTTDGVIPAEGATLTITVQPGKGFVPGMNVGAVDPTAPTTRATYGAVVTYNTLSGVLVIQAEDSVGVGDAVLDWQVSNSDYGTPRSRTITAAGLAVGGGSLQSNRTITVPKAAVADIRTGTDDTKATTAKGLVDSAAFITLTDAATIVWDAASGYNAKVVLGGNRTLGTPTNLKDGLPYNLDIIQPASGGPRTITLPAIIDFGVASVPTLSTGANKVDSLEMIYKAHTGKLHATFRKAA